MVYLGSVIVFVVFVLERIYLDHGVDDFWHLLFTLYTHIVALVFLFYFTL